MYRPENFREDRPDVLRDLIRRHPLGTLVTAAPALEANQIPFIVTQDEAGGDMLRAHMARANDQLAAVRDAAEVMVIFQGPEAYITPSWYPTKRKDGRAVPTWNYAAVHAWGRPRLIDDPAWVRAQIEALTVQQEADQAVPWKVSDAPADFTDMMLRHIVGLEIPIDRIEGKWKVNQNQPEVNRRGVVAGLRAQADGAAMADLVAERGGLA